MRSDQCQSGPLVSRCHNGFDAYPLLRAGDRGSVTPVVPRKKSSTRASRVLRRDHGATVDLTVLQLFGDLVDSVEIVPGRMQIDRLAFDQRDQLL